MSIKGAGIMFSSKTHILLGKKRRGTKQWGGFGGMLIHKNWKESPERGATRETLEEIYGINLIPLSADLADILDLEPLYQAHGYMVYHQPFAALGKIAKFLKSEKVYAPYYASGIPTTANGLVDNFRPSQKSEFTELRLFSFEELFKRNDVDKYLLEDLVILFNS